jgi:hypothetical protein
MLFKYKKAKGGLNDDYSYEEEQKSRINAELLLAVENLVEESQEKGCGERFILVTSDSTMRNLPAEVVQ